MPEEDLHLSGHARFQAHKRAASAARKSRKNVRLQPRFISLIRRSDFRFLPEM
jgi:hypothetical protein